MSGLSFRLFQQAGDLRVQTVLAKESAETNAELARVANQRADEVLTLSTTRQIEELESSARRLWPAGPELIDEYETWLARARALVKGRPADEGEEERGIPPLAEQVARLEALNDRARLLEGPEHAAVAEKAAARRPSLQARLERTRARRDWMRAMLARGPFPEQDASGPSVSARRALVLALDFLGPHGFDPARRARGRRLAEQAFETIDAEARPLAAIAMGWAELREGNPEDARTCLEMAREGAPDGGIEIGLDAAELDRELERWSDAALDQREAELDHLERAVVTLEVILGLRVLGEQDAWWQEQLAELVQRVEELHDPDAGLAGRAVAPAFGWGIARRLDWARQMEARARDPQHAARWRDALAAIAADPRYGGLRMRRIPGLEPLGVDPDSGLHEFAHVASGAAPQRGADGRLRIDESTGIVLVLLPGGRFWMGAQATDPDGRNYDELAQGADGPPHEVQLSPFLLSKYELTQAQWLRMNGDEPSQAGPGVSFIEGRLHPVEGVTWDEADECLGRFDLELPSEARWEYAARAGSATPWVWGAAYPPPAPVVNVADLAAKEAGAGTGWPTAKNVRTYRDGYVLHAPVGSFPPNALGLHETIGNVREWVLDSYSEAFYTNGPTSDPVCTADTASLLNPASRIFRGGSCSDGRVATRPAARSSLSRASRHPHQGMRPARSVPRED